MRAELGRGCIFGFIAAMAACSGTGDVLETDNGIPSQVNGSARLNMEKSQNATRPARRHGGATAKSMGASTMVGAADTMSQQQYEESCTIDVDEVGNIIRTCNYDGVACVERYDAMGQFQRWDCEGYGSYACEYGQLDVSCVYSDGQGFTCRDQWDFEWNLLSSTCPQEPQPGHEDCIPLEDGTIYCTYDDGTSTCAYVFDQDYNLLWAFCSGDYGTVECAMTQIGCFRGAACYLPVDVLSCHYAYVGYAECDEVYNTAAGSYGLLDSTCDWDMNGQPDCLVQPDNSLLCNYDDGMGTVCDYAFDPMGKLVFQTCTMPGGSSHCVGHAYEIVCEEIWGRQSCVNTYDFDWNYLNGVCTMLPCSQFVSENACVQVGCEWKPCPPNALCEAVGICEEPSAPTCEEMGGALFPWNPDYSCPPGRYYVEAPDATEGSICCVLLPTCAEIGGTFVPCTQNGCTCPEGTAAVETSDSMSSALCCAPIWFLEE